MPGNIYMPGRSVRRYEQLSFPIKGDSLRAIERVIQKEGRLDRKGNLLGLTTIRWVRGRRA
jgi:hypothetical protein